MVAKQAQLHVMTNNPTKYETKVHISGLTFARGSNHPFKSNAIAFLSLLWDF
jgi:hypothetical protein